MKMAKELGQTVKQAYVDVANTYQAVLMQDSGWTRQGILPELTAEIATEEASKDAEKSKEPEPEKDEPVIE